MKKVLVEEEFLSNQGCSEEYEWASYELYVDGEEVLNFKHNTEVPEENTLFHNFKDCLNILPLLETFYNLGKNNIDIEFKLKN